MKVIKFMTDSYLLFLFHFSITELILQLINRLT